MIDWIEHRRGLDRELLGWLRPESEGFVVIDLLGRERTAPLDWFAAEEFLEEIGMRYLAEKYELRLEDGRWQTVRIVEASPSRIRLLEDDGSAQAIGAPQVFHETPFPADPNVLRPHAQPTCGD